MTDPYEPPEEIEHHDETAEPEPAESMLSEFSGGEGMVALAGFILVAVWLIFEVIANRYSVSTLALVLGATAAILPRLKRDDVEKVHRLSVLMKVIGYALLLVGVAEIVSDVRFDSFDDFLTVIGALATYVAYAIAFVGARSIEI